MLETTFPETYSAVVNSFLLMQIIFILVQVCLVACTSNLADQPLMEPKMATSVEELLRSVW